MRKRIAMVAGAVLSMAVTAGTAGAQASDTTLPVAGLKSPATAEALGILPGGGFGMVYAGHPAEGILNSLVSVAAIAGGGYIAFDASLGGCGLLETSCHKHVSSAETVAGSALLGVGIGMWIYEAAHGGSVVRRDNARKIAAASDASRRTALGDVQAYVAPGTDTHSLAIGVHATW